MNSDNKIFNLIAIIFTSLIAINFTMTSFLLFRYNIMKTKILVDSKCETGMLKNIKNEQEEFYEMTHYKIPYNNLFIVKFKTSSRNRILILNEQELILIQQNFNSTIII